jgi:translation initiation factor 3 subunit I
MQSTKQSIIFHKRPITDLQFHPDGDVFFAASKDSSASMIDLNGKILGSFDKHDGSISTLASYQNNLLTGCLDLSVILWDILNGAVVNKIDTQAVVRGIDFTEDIFFCADNSMNKDPYIGRYDRKSGKIIKLISGITSPTKLFRYEDSVIFSNIEGSVYKLDLKTNNIVQEAKIHQAKVTSIKPSACKSFFVSCSSDSTVKILDSETFALKKSFECEEPINCANIFPTNDKVVAVGGINARDVTTTKGKSSFDTNFFDIVTQQKIGYFTTHFGTINAVDVHPRSTHICSGGEDGSICLIKLGLDFFNAPFTNFNQ